MIRKLLIGLMVFFSLLSALVAFFLFTGTGLRLAMKFVSIVSGDMVMVTGAEGRLLGKWSLTGVKIETGTATVALQKVECDWRPARLLKKQVHLIELAAEGLDVVLEDSGGEIEEKGQERIYLPRIAVPIEILVGRIRLDQGVVRQYGATGELFSLDTLSLEMRAYGDRVIVPRLHLETPEYRTELQAELQFSDDWPLTVTGEYRFQQEGYPEIKGKLSLSGSLEAPEADIEVLEPAHVRLRGKARDALNDLSWQVTGAAKEFSPSALNKDWPELKIGIQLSSEGTLEHYQADIQSRIEGDAFQPVDISLQLDGSNDHIRIDSAKISAAEGVVSISGEADWKEVLRWQAQIGADRVDPSVYKGMPAASIDARITIDGDVTSEGIRYRAKVDDLDGTLVEPALTVQGALELEGTEEGLNLSVARLETGGGMLLLSGDLSWGQALSWNAAVSAESVDPSVFGELPSGTVNARIHSSGSLAGENLEFAAEVKSLSGRLAGYDVDGGGVVEYRDSAWSVDNFHLTDGRNSLQLQGVVDDEFDVSFSLEGGQLDVLLPALKGGLRAQGSIGGTRDRPRLVVTVRSDGLAYEDYSVDSVAADIDFVLEEQGRVAASAVISGADIGGYPVDLVDVKISGSTGNNRTTVRVDSKFGNMSFDLSGALDESMKWCGSLAGIVYEHPDYGKWRQKGSSELEVSTESLKISPLCVYSGENGLCAAGEGDSSGTWSARGDGISFSLSKLNDWGFLTPDINGPVKGHISAAGKGAVLSTFEGTLSVPELVLDVDAGEAYPELKWTDTRIESRLAEEKLELKIATRFVDGSSLEGGILVDRFGDLSGDMTDLPISGDVTLDVRDLSPLEIVTGSYLVPSGRLSSSLKLTGKTGAPAVDGTLNLVGGELTFPELGVTLEDVEGQIRSTAHNLTLNLHAVSGEGELAVDGSMSFPGGKWYGEFWFKGDRVELINQSELGIVASPDLALKIGSGGGGLTGRVVIDQGRIEPEEMSGSDAESNDAILMDEQQEKSEWPFSIDIEASLGDDVRIDGYGLKGNLKGGLRVKMMEQDYLSGEGEVYLSDSVIELFGRRLDITRGRIIFDGGPVDSPGLDVSATKTIKGESLGDDDVVVGINVNGVIYDYNVELFSTPPMEESRILAYILLDKASATGEGEGSIISAAASSIGMGGGNGILGKVGELLPVDEMRLTGSSLTDDSSLVVGKKLTENFSIRYDYSLFKNIGYFIIRYNFGHGMAAETKSSTESNGIDLLYSFER